MNLKWDIEKIRQIAAEQEWPEIDHQENICMLSFKKDTTRVNVYYSTMTVGTCLNHPKKGKTQLYRRNVDEAELRKIMVNPRVHLNKGYRERKHAPDKF